jgi:hypothetical protein
LKKYSFLDVLDVFAETLRFTLSPDLRHHLSKTDDNGHSILEKLRTMCENNPASLEGLEVADIAPTIPLLEARRFVKQLKQKNEKGETLTS